MLDPVNLYPWRKCPQHAFFNDDPAILTLIAQWCHGGSLEAANAYLLGFVQVLMAVLAPKRSCSSYVNMQRDPVRVPVLYIAVALLMSPFTGAFTAFTITSAGPIPSITLDTYTPLEQIVCIS